MTTFGTVTVIIEKHQTMLDGISERISRSRTTQFSASEVAHPWYSFEGEFTGFWRMWTRNVITVPQLRTSNTTMVEFTNSWSIEPMILRRRRFSGLIRERDQTKRVMKDNIRDSGRSFSTPDRIQQQTCEPRQRLRDRLCTSSRIST